MILSIQWYLFKSSCQLAQAYKTKIVDDEYDKSLSLEVPAVSSKKGVPIVDY